MKKCLQKLVMLVFLCAPILIAAQDVSAETSYKDIRISDQGANYNDGSGPVVGVEGFNWKDEDKTLELTNYHGGRILIEDFNIDITLTGDNVIYSQYDGIVSGFAITIDGIGSLSMAPEEEGGDVGKVIQGMSSADRPVSIKGGVVNGGINGLATVIVDGGEWNNNSYEITTLMALLLKSGKISSNVPIMAVYSFAQDDGELNIELPTCEESDYECMFGVGMVGLFTSYAVFNGGKTTIKGGTVTSLYIATQGDPSKEELAEMFEPLGFTLPKNGLIEFNDGDITLESNGGTGALLVAAQGNVLVTLESLTIADNLQIDPETTVYVVVEHDTGGGGDAVMPMGMFGNGEGTPVITENPAPSATNVAKKVHIYPKGEEEDINVPKTGIGETTIDVMFDSTFFATMIGIGVAFVTYKTLRKAE